MLYSQPSLFLLLQFHRLFLIVDVQPKGAQTFTNVHEIPANPSSNAPLVDEKLTWENRWTTCANANNYTLEDLKQWKKNNPGRHWRHSSKRRANFTKLLCRLTKILTWLKLQRARVWRTKGTFTDSILSFDLSFRANLLPSTWLTTKQELKKWN